MGKLKDLLKEADATALETAKKEVETKGKDLENNIKGISLPKPEDVKSDEKLLEDVIIEFVNHSASFASLLSPKDQQKAFETAKKNILSSIENEKDFKNIKFDEDDTFKGEYLDTINGILYGNEVSSKYEEIHNLIVALATPST